MDLIERLQGVPLFANLTVDDLRHVAAICEERQVPPGTRLTRQADLGATLFIVDQGEAIIRRVDEQGHLRPVGMLHPGDSFGTTSLFLGEPRDATVIAATEMRVWSIHRLRFQKLLVEQPAIQHRLLVPEEILFKLRAPHYPWQEPGEVVLYACHRHILVFARAMAPTSVALLLYVAIMIGAAWYGQVRPSLVYASMIVIVLYSLILAWHWLDWNNDYYVVTTRRVTHHKQVALIYESRDEAPLDRVQNIKIEHDLWGSLFRYGDLTIETAAQVGRMFFPQIPHPERMSEAILNQLARARAMRRAIQRQLIRTELVTQMNVKVSEPPRETGPGLETPMVYVLDQVEAPEVRPGRLTRALIWLSDMGFFPRTRIETADSITWRKHWLFLVVALAFPSFLSLLFGILTVLGFFGIPQRAIAEFPQYPLVTLFLTLFGMGWFWWESKDWANDLYVVTKDRIIDTEKRPLFFAEQRREANLGMIQNISLRIPSLLAATFDYGDVLVQTAGSGEFTFNNVPTPHDVQREVFRRMEAFREAQHEREATTHRAEMAEWFSVYEELRRERHTRTTAVPPQDVPKEQ